MGYMRHNAILVTGAIPDRLAAAHAKARELCGYVSEIIEAGNGSLSFFVAPDGSNEGWEDSDRGDTEREAFVAWMNSERYEDGSSPFAWVEVQYGDDDRETKIVRDSDGDMPKDGEAA